MSVYHPDLFSKAILENEEQMVASNYFNQFARIDSAQSLSSIAPFAQPLFWWYNTSIGKFIARPQVPGDDVFNKYPQFQVVAAVRATAPIGQRPAMPATATTGTIYAPTFMVCGSNDLSLLCDSAIAKESGTQVVSGKEYKHGSFSCGHNLLKECTSEEEVKRVMVNITGWIVSKHPQRRRLDTQTAFSCDDLATDTVKEVCTAAQGLGLDKIPLVDGVKDLDRTLLVEVSSKNALPINAGDICSPNDCNTYQLPQVTGFRFDTSGAETDTAQTRGDQNGSPVVRFDCDAAEDTYTLLFWDAFGFMGGPSTRTSKGFLHGAWTNIKCNAQKKGNFTTAVSLVRYRSPANPSANFANNYGFYLFKQKSEVALTTEGTLSGFDVSAFDTKARGGTLLLSVNLI